MKNRFEDQQTNFTDPEYAFPIHELREHFDNKHVGAVALRGLVEQPANTPEV